MLGPVVEVAVYVVGIGTLVAGAVLLHYALEPPSLGDALVATGVVLLGAVTAVDLSRWVRRRYDGASRTPESSQEDRGADPEEVRR